MTPFADLTAKSAEREAKINEFRQLTKGWDSYKSLPLNESAAARALAIATEIDRSDIRNPWLCPCSDGGVQLEWHIGGYDIEISVEVAADSALSADMLAAPAGVYHKRRAKNGIWIEGSYEENSEALTALFETIAAWEKNHWHVGLLFQATEEKPEFLYHSKTTDSADGAEAFALVRGSAIKQGLANADWRRLIFVRTRLGVIHETRDPFSEAEKLMFQAAHGEIENPAALLAADYARALLGVIEVQNSRTNCSNHGPAADPEQGCHCGIALDGELKAKNLARSAFGVTEELWS